ncbi:hypothetical protein OKA05_06690 [Luteolibacter arcticus]|uniref:Uncharacterized protein n=1 Tax=Luteolibacter arcticus TaxID=1581411 RepID=A0ABT3GG45_9BACT|nr:hypothetical protein [Luteolibacter arcticus]MCW1922233.1 hypothetical protein [Luteolibacter arcticus]
MTERLLGADDTAYAVLRTERDNHASYYQTTTKVYFIERFTDQSTPEKSTLLSETETVVDATHNDPKTPPPVTTRVVTRDDSLSLAEALLRYPVSESVAWDAKQLAHLRSHPPSGISLDGRVLMASGERIAALFGSSSKDGEWKVSGAFEQRRSLFLSLEMEMEEGGSETRILGLGEDLSDQVSAHLQREDIYLSAGSFGSREEALSRIEAWKADKKSHVTSTTWEIWSHLLPTLKTDYVLVLAQTREMLEGGRSKRIEEATGIRFEAISSERFVERTRVP